MRVLSRSISSWSMTSNSEVTYRNRLNESALCRDEGALAYVPSLASSRREDDQTQSRLQAKHRNTKNATAALIVAVGTAKEVLTSGRDPLGRAGEIPVRPLLVR